MDQASAESILLLHIQDMKEMIGLHKGKGKEGGDVPSTVLAQTLQLEEMERTLIMLQDRRMCVSMSQAVDSDAEVLTLFCEEEAQAFTDRRTAHTLAGRAMPEAPTHENNNLVTDENLARLSSFNVASDCGSVIGYADSDAGEGSHRYFSARARTENCRLEECTACANHKPYLEMVLACSEHYYCKDCIYKLFNDATVDETLYPPRCCTRPIELSAVRHLLGKDLTYKFEQKAIEWRTPYRLYCPVHTCSAFILPPLVGGYSCPYPSRVACPACEQVVCSRCKREWHEGTCEADRDAEVLELTRAAGFQRCDCGQVVELTVGCYHMTCRCGRHFCYKCGASWKKCRCEHWDEENLQTRAEEIVARNTAELDRLGQQERQQRVAQMMHHLRERHECNHQGDWTYVRGGAICEMCEDYLPDFILQCANCRLLACRSCRRNRI